MIEKLKNKEWILCCILDTESRARNENVNEWDLLNDIGNKDIDKALQTLDKLIHQEVPIKQIITVLHKRLEDLYKCKVAISQNKDIATYLSLKPNQEFIISKYKRHINNYTEEELQEIIKILEGLETKGTNDLTVGLRNILYSIKNDTN